MSKVNQLQLLQQNLQSVLAQKQQLQSQLVELESALEQLGSASQAYKIVGKIMISAKKEELTKDLQEKKEVAEIRFKNFNKQEEKLRENLEKTQQEAMQEFKGKHG